MLLTEFVLDAERHRRSAELKVKVHAQTLSAKAETDDIITAIASAADKVTSQLKKYKGKLKDRDPAEIADLAQSTTLPDTDVEGIE